VVFKLAAELHETAAQSPVDLSPEILAQRTIERLDEIVMARTKTHLPRISMGDAARQAVDQMSAVMARGGAIGGITTGLKTLDCRTDGLNRGEFVLVAGRPGMGKSGLMESCARNTAAAGHNCLIFSLEMSSISDDGVGPDVAKPAQGPAPLRSQDAGRRLLPGQSGARQDALPLPRWQVDRPKDGGGSCTYRRGPATPVARLSREGSGGQKWQRNRI
jgi:hypothetical protein